MHKPEGYNSPKGAANNAAQKQALIKAKQAIQPLAEQLRPDTNHSTEKGNK